MTESAYDRLAKTPDGARSLARASLRSRVLGILNRALDERGVTQADLARKLGIRKSAVHRTLRGNGNVRMDTVADMLSALGYELYVTSVDSGELRAAMKEGREPCLNSWLPGDLASKRTGDRAEHAESAHVMWQEQFNFRADIPTHVIDEATFMPKVESVIQFSKTDPRYHLSRSGPAEVEHRLDGESRFFEMDEEPREPSPMIDSTYSRSVWVRGVRG